jgi:hypothetical protein
MPETTVEFHRLTFVVERDGVTVGRPDTETYVVLPDDGAELLRRLADGMAPADATGWYESTYGQPVDMADFLETLDDLGFVRAPDEKPTGPSTVRYRALGAAMFSPAAWAIYGLVVAAAIVVMTRQPELRPNPKHVFFLPSLIAVQAILMVTQIPGLLIHEWFHVMAGRRRGLPARLNVSRRLFFVVFETELNGLLGIPRKQRYLVFLSGMLADLLVITGLTLLATMDPSVWPAQLALAVAYLTLVRLAWQLLIFLRTDPYFVLTTLLGCTNLAEATSAHLKQQYRRIRGMSPLPMDEDAWTPRDRRYAPWFAVLTVIGTVGLVVALGFGGVPVVVEFVTRLRSGLAHGTAGGPLFWDSAMSLAVMSLQFAVLPLLAGRLARNKKRLASTKKQQELLSVQGAS